MHSKPEGSKVSHYDTLKQVQKTIGKAPEGLKDHPQMPDCCINVWTTFSLLADVTYTEIAAYTQVTGEEFQKWEVQALIGLDRIRKAEREWPKKQN